MAYTQATILTEVRNVLNESTASFWSDAQIQEWINQGCVDISAKAHCVEALTTIAIVQGTTVYTLATAAGSYTAAVSLNGTDLAVMRILAAYLNNIALVRAGIRVWGHQLGTGQVPPIVVSHWARRIYVAPPPSANGTLNLLVSVRTDDTRDIPESYQHLLIPFALYKAYQRDRKWTQAAQMYAEYANNLAVQRRDLNERRVDALEDLRVPDRVQRVPATQGA